MLFQKSQILRSYLASALKLHGYVNLAGNKISDNIFHFTTKKLSLSLLIKDLKTRIISSLQFKELQFFFISFRKIIISLVYVVETAFSSIMVYQLFKHCFPTSIFIPHGPFSLIPTEKGLKIIL